jgi:hypothetical protein
MSWAQAFITQAAFMNYCTLCDPVVPLLVGFYATRWHTGMGILLPRIAAEGVLLILGINAFPECSLNVL